MSVFDKLYSHLPYLLLIMANLFYLYVHGFKPLKYHPRLFIYNFALFFIIAIVVFFKVSYHLHRWFVLNEGDTKSKTKKALVEILQKYNMILNYLRPGNQHNLVYLYAVLAFWTFLSYLVPSFLLGLFFSLLYQIRQYITTNYSEQLLKIRYSFNNLISDIQNSLPRYQSPHSHSNVLDGLSQH